MTIALYFLGALLAALFVDWHWRRYEKGIHLITQSLTNHGCTTVRTDASWLDFARVRDYLVEYTDRSGTPTRNMCKVDVSSESDHVMLWMDAIQRNEQLSKNLFF
jgi:hypothetical protein